MAHRSGSQRRLSPLIILTIGLPLMACSTTLANAKPTSKSLGGKDDDTITLTSRMVDLDGGIGDAMIKTAQHRLLELDGQSHQPIWLRINSGGGSVEAGLILIDTMRGIQSPIYCLVQSRAYSMAAIILTFCDKRYALPHATIMLHEASYGTAGDDPTNRSRLDFLARYLDRLHRQIAKRLHLPLKVYKEKIRNAWWLLADEAAKDGVIDGVARHIRYEDLPVQRTEEKTTVEFKETADRIPKDRALPEIPKRRD